MHDRERIFGEAQFDPEFSGFGETDLAPDLDLDRELFLDAGRELFLDPAGEELLDRDADLAEATERGERTSFSKF